MAGNAEDYGDDSAIENLMAQLFQQGDGDQGPPPVSRPDRRGAWPRAGVAAPQSPLSPSAPTPYPLLNRRSSLSVLAADDSRLPRP